MRSPDSTALIYFGARISYRQLQEQVHRATAGLQALGVTKGDRVALMLGNCPQFMIGCFGALRAGAIVTATNTMYTARELTHQWNDAGPKVVIADRRLFPAIRSALPTLTSAPRIVLAGMRRYYPRPFARLCLSLDSSRRSEAPQSSASAPLPPARLACNGVHDWKDLLGFSSPRPISTAPSDIACLQYTGGTTGTSKGAMLTHANLVVNARQAMDWLSAGQRRPEVMVAALPFFHIYALTCVMISSVLGGGSIVILPRFVLRAALNVFRRYHPTIFHGVPTMYVAFNNAPDVARRGFNSLRICMSGGAPLPVEVREKFEALTGRRLVEGYGLTETSPVTHINPPTGPSKVGSIGLPVADTEARIVDLETGERELPVGEIGELAVRGPQVMKGYWNKPEETAQVMRDGWFLTGDIARKDADGYYYIVDRKKDMIIAGGYNIYPREVEEVLWEFPKTQEAAVIGVPDSYRGETVKAFVVLRPGTSATADEVIAFCRERLAAFKVPRLVVFRDFLPKSSVGKYLRRELRNL